MEWTLPETVSVATIMAAVLLLLYRFIGQRADPNLMALYNQTNTLLAKSMDGFDKLEITLQQHATALQNLTNGTTASFAAILQRVEMGEAQSVTQSNELIAVFRSFTVSVREDHDRALQEIMSIKPTIAELAQVQTAKLEQSEGLKQIMSATIDEQHRTNGEVMAALRRIQETLDELKREFPERIEKIEQDVNALRVDVLAEKAKSKAHADLSPLTPTPPTEPEPPTETETKDKAND